MYFGGVSDAQMRVRCSIGMHERKKQNENKNIFDFYKIAYHIEQAPPAVDSSIWNIYCRWGF